ncbi:MAG: hypothetical protein HC769_02085 [Cyanobacteria bacterium CRU_2_1]|nr:hypothetical protein [Cyanobacteria bacterium RU_5_0]NJR57745.1 hypothetical protein [Cyanobacteria bacterium CRU_2_1]
MSLSLTNSEHWYTAYEAASAKQQYDMLLEAIAQPLSPELIEELDLGMILLVMRDELVNNNLLDQAIHFIQTLQEKQPDLYQQEFPFFDNLLVEYYLFHNQPEQARSALMRFMINPADDIDQTLAVLDYLKFYDATDLAVELSSAAYEPVRTSSKVLPGVEIEFSRVILNHQIQQAYRSLKNGEVIDWDAFLAEAVKYGYENTLKWVNEIHHHLISDIESNPEFLTQFKRDRDAVLRALSTEFCRSMLEQKQTSFVCSYALWQELVHFLESRDLPRKQLSQPDLYFTIHQSDLDRYVAQKIGGLLSTQQAVGFAILWGIPYIYDWLQSKQMIQDEVYKQAIAVATALKTQLVEGFKPLWKYNFIHRWLPPDSIPTTEFDAETKEFAASLDQVTPLSEESGHSMKKTLLNSLAPFVSPEMLQAFDEAEDEAIEAMPFEQDADGEDGEDAPTPTWVDPPIRSFKPEKPRKSALKLASELPTEGKKPANKSKKKKKR